MKADTQRTIRQYQRITQNSILCQLLILMTNITRDLAGSIGHTAVASAYMAGVTHIRIGDLI
jgi:hypothetical protein